ncbi:MAG: GTPase [Candidatus Woesearchaeota archaeon]
MADNKDKIKELEAEVSKTKYNKRTQHSIGLLKAKIAQLKEKEIARSSKKSVHTGYSVRRTGDATIIMIGFPSSGKSTLLNAITNADSPVGAYEFTTLDVIPGLMEYKGAKIQVLDVPGIVMGAASGRGRGREVLSVMQSADMVMVLIDVLRPNTLKVIEKEIYDSHLRLNQKRPDVKIRKTARGGIRIGRTVPTPDLNNETIIGILKEFRISNADVLIRTRIDADQLIDVVEGNKVYVPGMTILNKIDIEDSTIISSDECKGDDKIEENNKKIKALEKRYDVDVAISGDKKINLEKLKDLIFDRMEFIRVYCKEVGKKADMDEPLILRKGDTLKRMCEKLHKDFVQKFKFARILGDSVKYDGQKVMKLHHKLKDKDVVELHIG